MLYMTLCGEYVRFERFGFSGCWKACPGCWKVSYLTPFGRLAPILSQPPVFSLKLISVLRPYDRFCRHHTSRAGLLSVSGD